MKINQVEEDMLHRGIMDDRRLYVYASNKSTYVYPGGVKPTLVILTLKGNTFNVCEAKLNNDAKNIIFRCPLSKMENFKFKPGAFFTVLSFTVGKDEFKFTNFEKGKKFVPAFKEAGILK
ncbi:MAG: hypothetical protein WBL80_04510 [Erysipelotrichaceae bacterium]